MAKPTDNLTPVRLIPGRRLRSAMALAILADLIQLVGMPFFWEGAASPADDVVDLVAGALFTWLLGWHWEFAPSFLAELIPGASLVPFWTLAVFNVYRKERKKAQAALSDETDRS